VDVLNLTLSTGDPAVARERVAAYLAALAGDGTRLTAPPDFDTPVRPESATRAGAPT
jgi:hypothetical protein